MINQIEFRINISGKIGKIQLKIWDWSHDPVSLFCQIDNDWRHSQNCGIHRQKVKRLPRRRQQRQCCIVHSHRDRVCRLQSLETVECENVRTVGSTCIVLVL